jgi:hypothetical protein
MENKVELLRRYLKYNMPDVWLPSFSGNTMRCVCPTT